MGTQSGRWCSGGCDDVNCDCKVPYSLLSNLGIGDGIVDKNSSGAGGSEGGESHSKDLSVKPAVSMGFGASSAFPLTSIGAGSALPTVSGGGDGAGDALPSPLRMRGQPALNGPPSPLHAMRAPSGMTASAAEFIPSFSVESASRNSPPPQASAAAFFNGNSGATAGISLPLHGVGGLSGPPGLAAPVAADGGDSEFLNVAVGGNCEYLHAFCSVSSYLTR